MEQENGDRDVQGPIGIKLGVEFTVEERIS